MRVRFHTELDGTPHIYAHDVSEKEVLEVLAAPLERLRGRDTSSVTIGRTRSGRLLKVVDASANDGDGVFVITAFDLPPKQIRALNRRLKRRRKS
jgi:hypothetical protein